MRKPYKPLTIFDRRFRARRLRKRRCQRASYRMTREGVGEEESTGASKCEEHHGGRMGRVTLKWEKPIIHSLSKRGEWGNNAPQVLGHLCEEKCGWRSNDVVKTAIADSFHGSQRYAKATRGMNRLKKEKKKGRLLRSVLSVRTLGVPFAPRNTKKKIVVGKCRYWGEVSAPDEKSLG